MMRPNNLYIRMYHLYSSMLLSIGTNPISFCRLLRARELGDVSIKRRTPFRSTQQSKPTPAPDTSDDKKNSNSTHKNNRSPSSPTLSSANSSSSDHSPPIESPRNSSPDMSTIAESTDSTNLTPSTSLPSPTIHNLTTTIPHRAASIHLFKHSSYASKYNEKERISPVMKELYCYDTAENTTNNAMRVIPRQFEYNPGRPDCLVCGTISGEIIVVNPHRNKVIAKLTAA